MFVISILKDAEKGLFLDSSSLANVIKDSVDSIFRNIAEAETYNKSLNLGSTLIKLKALGNSPIDFKSMTKDLYKIALICKVTDEELAEFFEVPKQKVKYWYEKYGLYRDSRQILFTSLKVNEDVYKHYFKNM